MEDLNKKLFILLFLTIMISCYTQESSKENELVGVYVKDTSPYQTPYHTEIAIYANKKAEYILKAETYGNIQVSGTWALKQDTLKLVLSIPKQKEQKNLKIKYLNSNVFKDSVLVSVFEKDKKTPLVGSTIKINDNLYDVDSKGQIRIVPTHIDKIEIEGIGVDKKLLKLDKKISQDFIIIYQYDEERSIAYDLLITKWYVKNNRLYAISNGNVDEKNFLINKDK